MANCLWHKATASDAGWELPWMRRRLLAYVYRIVYKQKLVSMGCTARAHLRAPPIPPARPPAAPAARGPPRMPHPQAPRGNCTNR